MLFADPHFPARQLAPVCRSLATMLESGVGILKALDVVARKSGSFTGMQPVIQAVTERVRKGDELHTAFRTAAPDKFPDLFLDMMTVGETTGSLPEVLQHLAAHYDNVVQRKKQFSSAIAWPVFQLVAAIFVIAIVIWVLGFIPKPAGMDKSPVSGVVFGLEGTGGALIWLLATFGTAAGLWLVYRMLKKNVVGQQFLDPLLLKIPVLGGCLTAFAIARFSWAFGLTQGAGMSIKPALETSLRATANGAFISQFGNIWTRLKEGEHMWEALQASNLFPFEFISIVQTSEESGTIPEGLARLSRQFDEDANRSMKRLTSVLGWGVWLIVAIIIITLIFRFAMFYVNLINSAGQF